MRRFFFGTNAGLRGQDAEEFDQILFCLERLGLQLHGAVGALGRYRNKLIGLAAQSPLADEIPRKWPVWHAGFGALYDELLDARNDALHQGAFARSLTGHAVQMALVVEDALMTNGTLVSQFMVRSPDTAELWQPISFVRQVMLSKSYSFLPLWYDHKGRRDWWFLGESEVAKYLRVAESNEDRNKRLAATVVSTVEGGLLSLIPARTIDPQALVREAVTLLQGSPLLVVGEDDPTRLLGILTAFDVL